MSKIVTIGTTLSGNKGAASMLISLIKNFRQYDPLTEFVSLSYYPQSQEKRFNVYENLRIVPVTPKKLVFFLLPLSLIFFLFSWIAPVKKLCLRYRPLREIHEADLFVDISGISFSDGRGLIIIFNILCVLIPLCMRKRIIKYSQALGPFETKMNRFFAKLLLPRVDTIIARGDATKENLDALGLEKTHTKADGALSFPLSPSLISSRMRKLLETLAAKQKAKERLVVGISPSSVVYKYCERNGIDYAGILRRLTKTLLNREDILVVLFPYSARQGKEKMKNNDIPIVKMVARGFSSSNRLAVIRNEYSAEDLNLLISKMDVLVTSRFHGMIAALSAKVVPDVIGWSHKYEEIMKGYGIADLSISHKSLTYEMLETLVFGTIRNLDRYKRSIEANYQKMQDSSLGNMKIIDKELAAVQKKNKFYLGDFKDCFAGFSLDAGLRERAASGGMVTAYLSYLFDIGAISSALVSRMESKDGKLQAVPFFAQSKEELLGAQSSIYFDFPLEHSFRTIKEQKGKVAVVALPQQLKILDAMMGTDAELSKKVYRKIGLFCGHASEKRLLEAVLESKGITESAIEKFYFRQGRWRGTSRVELRSGEVVEFPYNDFGTLQNLYLHCPKRCHFCHDHYAEHADISFGDIWLKSFKKKEVKHSLIIARTQESLQDLYSMKQAQLVHLQGLPPKKAIAAQKRALIYHKHTVNALKRLQKTGVPIAKPRWNDYVAAGIILFNGKISRSPRAMKLLMHLPRPVLRAYMFVEKFFMNF